MRPRPGKDRTVTAAQPPPGPAAQRRLGRPSNERFRDLFTRNLNRLLDERQDVPREHSARATELARLCRVTPAAARKWLTGGGLPTLEKLLELAQRYGFAPDDLLSEGPRQVIDISRLVDAQALRRAELAELAPVPEFDSGRPSLALAIDPVALFGAAAAGGDPLLAQLVMPDDSMAPMCVAGDRVVFRLDPQWTGDGFYLVQAMAGAPLTLRSVSRQADGYRIEALSPAFAARSYTAGALAADEASALGGEPILSGRPLCLLRALPGPVD